MKFTFAAFVFFYAVELIATGTFKIPQPTSEFPLVLFAGDNYNNGSEGIIHRSRPGVFHVWARTLQNSIQEFVFRSLLVLPGWRLTFQACCPSGNIWSVPVSYNVSNISSLHYFMFDHLKIGEGIFYTQWLHWQQEFSVKVDRCEGCSKNSTACAKTCYFGACGLDGTCQCKDGYSGDQCEHSPSDTDVYPSLGYPLLLFPNKSFQGTPIKVFPDVYQEFANNVENTRMFTYLSARVLFTRAVTFSRNKEADQVYELSPGSDISDLKSFFSSNVEFGTPLWFNYAKTIVSTFYIKVAGDSRCTSCNEVGGCCYRGKCVCLPGYNGTFCDEKL